MTIGIVGYGGYVPQYRITAENIGAVWGVDGAARGKMLGIERKSVPSPDEDVITIAVSAARGAMKGSGINPKAVFLLECDKWILQHGKIR